MITTLIIIILLLYIGNKIVDLKRKIIEGLALKVKNKKLEYINNELRDELKASDKVLQATLETMNAIMSHEDINSAVAAFKKRNEILQFNILNPGIVYTIQTRIPFWSKN